MSRADEISDLNQWLLTEGRAADRIADFLSGYAEKLLAAGCQIDRATIGAPLAHPIARSSFSLWVPGKPPVQ